MAAAGRDGQLNGEIKSITPYNIRPLLLHGYVAPFIILYSIWGYSWVFIYGVDDHYELGLIALAIIGFLQILTSLFCLWFVSVRTALTCSRVRDTQDAKWVQVVPTANNGFPELVRLKKETDLTTGKTQTWFVFQKMKYVFDAEEKKRFEGVQFPEHHVIKHYLEWKGYQDEKELSSAEKQYGKNDMEMDIPTFMELFKERATAPFFVFQVFCVGLWCLDEYWYYSLFTLFMLVVFEATLVQKQISNVAKIRAMGSKPYMIQCYRNRKWRMTLSCDLVPGDIISVSRSPDSKLVPCDVLLLRGSCIVDESMLTGESVPVMKESIEGLDGSDVLDLEQHAKLHLLCGGTKVVQHTAPSKSTPGIKVPDNGCIGYVVRNSFSTSQGKLLRTILYSVKSVTANNFESFLFILFLLIFAVIAAAYVWVQGTKDPNRNRYKLFLECTLILTSVVPPELPIELSLAVNNSLLALSKLYVFCTEPFRIPFAGKVDMCCFDKTGTLTSDNLVVEGVAGLKGADIMSVTEVPLETTHVLATCHALAQLEDDLVGDPLEKATLKAVDWNLTKGDAVVPKKGKTHGLKIFQRFHFASSLKRMSVIAGHTSPGAMNTEYIASVKGAPETLKSMFSEVPGDYEDVYLAMARRGARVLALGHRKLGQLSHQEVRDMSREDVEKDLKFVGFVIISCPLKSDSKAVIKEIQHASHHVVMITGDNPLTACHVARELRITRKPHTCILTPPRDVEDMANSTKENSWQWKSIDDSIILPAKPDKGHKELTSKYDLCVTGQALDYLQTMDTRFLHQILPYVKVYARVAPKQKEHVITTLKDLGYVTLMCGDGTNDVGALKHADVGVALLANAPERMPTKKKRRENDHMEERQPQSPQDRLAAMTASRGQPMGRHAKSRAMARGDNLHMTQTNAQKRLADIMKELDEEEEARVVQLGDASIASPFTSKLSTPMCVCHIIKQGRCTLVTTLQMFKILALNALILAYSQSVLYLEGVKFSDTQAAMQGLLLAGCFLFKSSSKPLKTLSKSRPLPNIFNVYTLLTVLCQFAVHFASLVYLKQVAQAWDPVKVGTSVDLEAEFKPNLLNTTVYIISVAMQISTFAVNYKGHPFMESLRENTKLLYSLLISGFGILALASGFFPNLSAHFEFVEMDAEFRNIVMGVLFVDMVGTFLIDRVLQFFLGTARLRAS